MEKNKISMFGKLPDKVSNISQIDTYFNMFKSKDAISDDVYNDLNIEDLFHFSNRCVTPIGEMILYCRFRHLHRSGDNEKTEAIIDDVFKSISLRERLETILSKLSRRINCSVSGIFEISIKLSKWHKYIKFLPIIYVIVLILLWGFQLSTVFIVALVCMLIINTILHFWNKLYVETCVRPLIQLSMIKSAAVDISDSVDNYYDTKQIKDSIHIISKLEKKIFIFGLNKYLESDLAILLSFVVDFLKIFFLIEPIVINHLASKMIEIELHSKRLIDYIGEWDNLFSNASLRAWLADNNLRYSTPIVAKSEAHSFNAKEIYNPLIPNCVTNDVDISNTIIITGSNMSGKSTFLRTIGINIVSSYALNISYASYMRFMNYQLYSVLSVSDDINQSTSYFRSEVERVKYAIDMCSNSHPDCTNIVLIDEIFKGTNTIERISIANAVIKYFTRYNNTLVIVSTHDIELAKSFLGILDVFHFDETVEDKKISFDYKLKNGLEYTRNAIELLKYCNYPSEIIACAESNRSLINISFSL